MRLALLKGNRFNPWHLQVYNRLGDNVKVTAFRADSEIQRRFDERDDNASAFHTEPIYFETQVGNPLARLTRRAALRFLRQEPHIWPFYERLKGYDIIQSWELFTDWTAQAVLAKEAYGIPLAIMVWDNIPFNQEPGPEARLLKERAMEAADVLIVHTERSYRTLCLEGVNPNKIVKVLPGVDTDLFSPGPADRTTLGLDKDEFVILFVGWLLPRKGLDFLLLALRELLNDSALHSKKIRLVAIGSGPGQDRVDALVSRAGLHEHCLFPGAQPYNRMPDWFRAADAFVLPSIATPTWQEQFGMSLIEALSCGTPVIASRSGAIAEILGDAGELVQPNDFATLSDALKRLMFDPDHSNTLRTRGHQRAVESFSLDSYANELATILASLTPGFAEPKS